MLVVKKMTEAGTLAELKGRFDFLYSDEEDLFQNLRWKSVKSG